jgi:hypothetical protein
LVKVAAQSPEARFRNGRIPTCFSISEGPMKFRLLGVPPQRIDPLRQ